MKDLHEIGKNTFVVRARGELSRNIYIKRFQTDSGSINMILDPGGKTDLPMVIAACKELIGGIENLHIIFVNHQDPDVASNVGTLQGMAPRSVVISSIDTFRLIRFYGIDEKRFRSVEQFSSGVITLKRTGHKIQLIPSYYCHFRGAVMCYDYESQILFSGDFLGGITSKDEGSLYATESSWEGISLFHQIYMPSREALRQTVERITLLPSIPSVIAPQHGNIIKDNLVVEFLTRVASLSVGVELMKESEASKETFLVALNEILDTLANTNPTLHAKIMEEFKRPRDFTTLYILSGNSVTDIKIAPPDAVMFLKNIIEREASETEAEQALGVVTQILKNYELLKLEGMPQDMAKDDETARADIF